MADGEAELSLEGTISIIQELDSLLQKQDGPCSGATFPLAPLRPTLACCAAAERASEAILEPRARREKPNVVFI